MFQVYPEYTFSKLLEVALAKSTCSFVDENMYSECKGYLSNDIKLRTRVEVPLEFSVIECCEANGNCVRFIFTVLAEPTSPSYRNAAEVLMSSAQKLFLPNEIDSNASSRGVYGMQAKWEN